ncbi:MAG TPA: PAC2 family protein [Micromonosporaceae bacterium]
MLDPFELYDLVDDPPALDRPVLIHALTGFVDAGSGIRLAHTHLLSSLEHRLIATFDIDQLFDYRSRRPPMILEEHRWVDYRAPKVELHLVRDDGGVPFLLLGGPEPDLQWERFVSAVVTLVERFDVRLTVGLNAIPMAVPHTRPTGVTAHATRPELLVGHDAWLHRVQVPASIGNLLEYRLGQRGRDALGFAAHVPHYVAQLEYPSAAEQLLTAVCLNTGLLLPVDRLRTAAELVRIDIDRQVAETTEATEMVRSLEEQYDAFARGSRGDNLLAGATGHLPTADEIAAELERFLAEQHKPGENAG